MSSTHEPFHLLEPSNLLEPFDPRDCHDDLANWSARLRGDEGPPKDKHVPGGRPARFGSPAIVDRL
jgi:hypothetical protein